MMVVTAWPHPENAATATAASAPSVAPTVGMRSAMATHMARAAANGIPKIRRKTNAPTPAMTETAMLPDT